MFLTSTPDPDEILIDLKDVTDAVWEALEAGAQHAREYFDSRGLDVDPFLAAHLTRFEARRLLEQHQHEAEYERRELSNSGLRLVAVRHGRRYDIRIRRSDDGRLPATQSDAMDDFYYQPVLDGIDTAHIETINLVALWVTPENYAQVTSLSLACPAAGGDTKSDVQAHWYKPVPHPATTSTLEMEFGEDVAAEEPISDLPIEILPQEQTGTDSDSDDEE